MLKKNNDPKSRRQNAAVVTAGVMILGVLILNIGCGRAESPSADAATKEPSSPSAAASGHAAVSTPPPASAIPAPDVPEDAPVLADVYPTLSGGALRLARLADLPPGTLLQAEGVSVTEREFEDYLSQAPADMREQLRKHAFLILEQKATQDLLVALARRRGGNARNEDQLLQAYFEDLTRTVTVTDDDVRAFYEENRAMVGDTPFEQLKPRIREHVLRERQQEVVERHVRELGREMTIAMSAEWVERHAAAMLDNPLDKARSSGKPTFASFGADTCIPCQKMKPTREAIGGKYGDRLNLVYVHVNEDQMLASRYGVRGIPHIIFFDASGAEVHAQSGLMTQEQIEEWLAKTGVTL